MNIAGGIDLGGTKIEAQLFAADWSVVANRRVATPKDYPALVAALAELHRWLRAEGGAELPVGLGFAGFIDPLSGIAYCSNLSADGKDLGGDLAALTGEAVPMVNDARAFTLSEARLGAGRDYRLVIGLILGTGVAGGLALDGRLPLGMLGVAGEYGHSLLPHGAMTQYRLPMLQCGCGRIGCYETLLSGPGMTKIAEALGGAARTSAELSQAAAAGEAEALRVMAVWADLAGEMLLSMALFADAECVVLGGGLSRMPGVAGRLTDALRTRLLPGMRCPAIVLAEGGDASGARGAALAALEGASFGKTTATPR